jgi:hypothetical protein
MARANVSDITAKTFAEYVPPYCTACALSSVRLFSVGPNA